jgi:hypothetical protein
VIHIAKSDNDVFEALACDSFALRDSRDESGTANDSDRNNDDIWTQVRAEVLKSFTTAISDFPLKVLF